MKKIIIIEPERFLWDTDYGQGEYHQRSGASKFLDMLGKKHKVILWTILTSEQVRKYNFLQRENKNIRLMTRDDMIDGQKSAQIIKGATPKNTIIIDNEKRFFYKQTKNFLLVPNWKWYDPKFLLKRDQGLKYFYKLFIPSLNNIKNISKVFPKESCYHMYDNFFCPNRVGEELWDMMVPEIDWIKYLTHKKKKISNTEKELWSGDSEKQNSSVRINPPNTNSVLTSKDPYSIILYAIKYIRRQGLEPDLIDIVNVTDIEEKKVFKLLENLKKKGQIFCSKPGIYQVIE